MSNDITRTLLVDPRDLVLDARCQARVELDADTIEEYAALYLSGEMSGAIEAYRVDGSLYVIDGFHRTHAAREANCRVEVEIVGEGSIESAEYAALGANVGPRPLRRTNADKRKAVRRAVRSPVGWKKSLRGIADHVGVSQEMVRRYRAEYQDELSNFDSALGPQEGTSGPANFAGGEAAPPTTDDKPLPFELDDEGDEEPDPLDVWIADHEAEAKRLEAAVRAAQRIAREVGEADTALATTAKAMSVQLLELARQPAQAVPVRHQRCAGAGCKGCLERGWVAKHAARREARAW